MPLVGQQQSVKQTPKEPIDPKVQKQRYVAQLYVSRRKVWEYRTETEDDAYRRARQEKAKYRGSRATIVVRDVSRA